MTSYVTIYETPGSTPASRGDYVHVAGSQYPVTTPAELARLRCVSAGDPPGAFQVYNGDTGRPIPGAAGQLTL